MVLLVLPVVLAVFSLKLWETEDVSQFRLDFLNWDLLCEFYPHLLYSARVYAEGTIPLWNPEEFGGYPHLASGQTGVLYPPYVLFWLKPGTAGLVLLHLFHLTVAGLGGYWLARTIGAGASAAGLGFVVTACGMPMAMGAFLITRSATQSWGPLLLALVLVRDRWWRGPGLALVYALSILGGYLPYAVYLGVGAVVVAAAEGVRRRCPWTLPSTLGGLFLGAGLASPVLLPVLELWGQSTRAEALPSEMLWGDAVGWQELGTMLLGSPEHVVWMFFGAVPAGLALYAFLRRPVSRPLGLIAVLGGLHVLGAVTPVSSLVLSMPLLGSFRGLRTATPLLFAPLGALAAVGLETLCRSSDVSRRWGGGLLAGSLAALALGGGEAGLLAAELALIGAGLLLLRGRLLVAVVIGVSFLRLLLATSSFPPYVQRFSGLVWPPQAERTALADLYPQRVASRLGRMTALMPGTISLTIAGGATPIVRAAAHPQSLPLTRVRRLYDTFERGFVGTWTRPRAFATLASPIAVERSNFQSDKFPPANLPGVDDFLRRFRIRSVLNPTALPRAYVAGTVEWAEGPDEALRLVTQPGRWDGEAVLEAPASVLPARVVVAGGRAELRQLSANRARIEVEAPDGGWLIVSESYYPGWQSRVDGRSRTILPANGTFRGVPVSPGASEVVFTFEPRSFQHGLFGGLVCLMAVMAAIRVRSPGPSRGV